MMMCVEVSAEMIVTDCFPLSSFILKVQAAIEELLSVGCETEPTSAKILFHCGFEKEGRELLWQISSIYCENGSAFMT